MEDANTTQAISELPELQKDPYFNFLKIIRQEDNELAFSNMLAHFFNIKKRIFPVLQVMFYISRYKQILPLREKREKLTCLFLTKIMPL
jgi:hypothetical protein